MTKILAGIAALTSMGAAALPASGECGRTEAGHLESVSQSTDVSAQRRYWRHRYYGHRYWGPRPLLGSALRLLRLPVPYGYGYPYGYYGPGVAFGIGPFGFGVF